jgi:hypothetical protein
MFNKISNNKTLKKKKGVQHHCENGAALFDGGYKEILAERIRITQ